MKFYLCKLGQLTFGEKFRTFSPSGSIGNEYKVIGFIPNRGALCEYTNQPELRRVLPLNRDVLIDEYRKAVI